MAHGLLVSVFRILADELRPNVTRHDDDRVLEADHAALPIGQTAVVEHLQQHVEHVGMCLLDLVEQNDAVGTPTHGLGQLAALVIAHVSGRGTDETLHAELFHVLGHVDAHHVLLAVEQVFCKRFGELGLAHAGRAQEHERADGTIGVGKPRAVAADGAGHDIDGLVLADDTLVQLGLEVDELFHLAAHHLADGDSRPRGHDLGDFLLGHLLLQQGVVFLTLVELTLGIFQLLAQAGNGGVAQLGSA